MNLIFCNFTQFTVYIVHIKQRTLYLGLQYNKPLYVKKIFVYIREVAK
jgi:hypothetical protein